MNKEIHSVDEFEKECYDVLNQDIETIKNEMLYEKYQKNAHLSSMLLELIEATSLLTNNPIA